MKLIAERELLADKLKKSMKFVPSKTLISAQENFRCVVKDNVMEIMAADSQTQIKIYCPVKSDVDFSFCVEAEIFLKTISLFRENEVRITKKSETILELKNGKASTYKITMDCFPDDYPVMPPPQNTHELSLSQHDLKMSLKFTEKFTDDEKSGRVTAEAISINVIDKRLVFTALDTRILCRVNVPPLAIGSWAHNIILPEETATKVISILNEKGEVAMCHDGGKIIFFTDDSIERFEITSTLKEGKYPDSEKLFGKKGEDYAIMNTLEVKDVFQRLKLYSSDQEAVRVIQMATKKDNVNELVLSASSLLKPKEGEETITIKNVCGKPMNKKFNSGLMLKILSNIESNEFMFFFQESDKMACFIEPVLEELEVKNFNFLICSTS